MIDELRQIAIFARAVDHGTFKGAADDLRLAPSVVSHHISQLEAKLGVTLIYRTTRKFTLTPEGERLLKSAHIMNDAVTAALDDLRGTLSEPSGVLRVTATSGLSQSRLIKHITDFCARHPKIDIRLEFSDQRRHLIEDGFDVSIQVGAKNSQAPNRQTLFEGRRCIAGASSYLSQFEPIKTPDDLKGLSWVMLAGVKGSNQRLTRSGQSPVKIDPVGQITANSSLAVYRFVKEAAGIAIVPEFLTEEDVSKGDVQIVLPDWDLEALDVFAEWPSNASKDGIVSLFVADLCRSENMIDS
ncbi:LysR family transcriptional regulator [Algirhabdus cladophorae]|uniref:LysR family transcriptional regulator n=1 Tax=Algirhabdus cladophorae TaxID=3377108 RepID=UPI003B84B450